MHRATYRYREQSQVDFDGLVQWPILVNILTLKVLATILFSWIRHQNFWGW